MQTCGCAENVLSAHFHAILAVDEYHAGVGYIQCGNGTAHEVVGAGAVDDVEFFVEELGVEHGREYRVSVFLLYREIVGYGVFGFNCAAAFYNPTLVEHSFGECGFSGAFAAKQGYVFDFLRFVEFHDVRVSIFGY